VVERVEEEARRERWREERRREVGESLLYIDLMV
jgi:hypothetical protein